MPPHRRVSGCYPRDAWDLCPLIAAQVGASSRCHGLSRLGLQVRPSLTQPPSRSSPGGRIPLEGTPSPRIRPAGGAYPTRRPAFTANAPRRRGASHSKARLHREYAPPEGRISLEGTPSPRIRPAGVSHSKARLHREYAPPEGVSHSKARLHREHARTCTAAAPARRQHSPGDPTGTQPAAETRPAPPRMADGAASRRASPLRQADPPRSLPTSGASQRATSRDPQPVFLRSRLATPRSMPTHTSTPTRT